MAGSLTILHRLLACLVKQVFFAAAFVMALHLLRRDFLVFLLRFLRIFSFCFFSLVRQAFFRVAFFKALHLLRRDFLAFLFRFSLFHLPIFLFQFSEAGHLCCGICYACTSVAAGSLGPFFAFFCF